MKLDDADLPRTRAVGEQLRQPPAAATWDLWVTGGLRRRIALTDGGDEALAELWMPQGRRRRRRRSGTAEGRDGVLWLMRDDGAGVTVWRDGTVHAAVRGATLEAGDHRYDLELHGGGLRSALVTGPGGKALLRVQGDGGHRRPWATLAVDRGLLHPVPAVLAVVYTLLRDEADGERVSVVDLVSGLIPG